MKRLPLKIFIVCILGLGIGSVYAQNPLELSLLAGAKYQPPNFTWLGEADPNSIFPDRNYRPILQGGLLLQQVFQNDFLKWEAGLSFRHVQNSDAIQFRPPTNIIDPDIPQGDISMIVNQIGAKLGLGYHYRSRQRKFKMEIMLGAQCHLPLSANTRFELNGETQKFPIFGGNHIENFTYYGLYLRPTFLFNFSNHRRKAWYFGPYLSGDFLIHHKAAQNPKWAAGGGVQVNFVFR